MHLKRYTFFSLLLIAAVSLFVYSQTESKYTIEFFGVPVTLPIAAWIAIVMALFYFASLFHMAYYSFRSYIKGKKYQKDYETIVKSLFNAILKEPKGNYYKTPEFKNLGAVTDRAYIELSEFNFECKEDMLKKAAQYVKDIQRGEYVEIKEITLSPKNPIYCKNLENRLKEEPTYSGVILRKCSEFPQKLCKKALAVFMGYAELSKIKEYVKLFDKELLDTLLKEAAKEGRGLDLTTTDLLYIVEESPMEFTAKDYLELARKVKEIFLPDERLKLFELLKAHDEKAEEAFIYTLLDLEMIERAKDELQNSDSSEFLGLKAFVELKDCGRNYPLELFV